jgi:hypothetical protein
MLCILDCTLKSETILVITPSTIASGQLAPEVNKIFTGSLLGIK